jgi:hypothetical protein
MPKISTFRAWRIDLAARLTTGADLLRAVLVTDGIHSAFVFRIANSAQALEATAAALRAPAGNGGILALAEIVSRLDQAVKKLRVVVIWRGVSSPSAHEDLTLVLDDLEEVLREASTIASLPAPELGDRAHA